MNYRDRLDRIFSLYIRFRDCPDGMGRCISCGKRITPTTCDCGHFIPRSHLATRWNELNCAAQCYTCNRLKDGNTANFARRLTRRYGDGIIDRLMAAKHTIRHISKSDFEDMIKYYTKKWREIK